MLDSNCVFCENIIKHKEAAIVTENEYAIAFMDYAPVEPGHVLVIPKDHFVDIFDINQTYYLEVHKMVRKVARATLEAMSADAINVGQNNGVCANQRVMHYHVHIIPRWCSHPLNWDRTEASFQKLQLIADQIRGVYQKYYGDGTNDTKL